MGTDPAGSVPGLVTDEHGVTRCWWGGGDQLDYRSYHDDEWGMPVVDDVRLFEKLSLEGFQSGLSWLTILRKREAFQAGVRGLRLPSQSRASAHARSSVLLEDASIVRHRGKIESTINNARRALELVEEEGSLAAFVWRFEPEPEARPSRMTHAELQGLAQTDASRALAKELKRRGWSFVGPTTVYAFMQAMGLVNDHLEGCAARPRVEAARNALDRARVT